MRLALLLLLACNPPDEGGPGFTPDVGWTDTGSPPKPVDPSATHSWDYVLFSPIGDTVAWLIDEHGEAVWKWETDRLPGESVYLLDDGSLLRTGTVASPVFAGGGLGGSVHRYSWSGEVLWEFTYATETVHQHHDLALLPNGNILMIAWEAFTDDELREAGRDPALVWADGGWMEQIIEVDPSNDEIVWTWRVMDHVAQDRTPDAANYVPAMADHPERIDIDYAVPGNLDDWLHANAIDYNAELDQIVLSVHHHSELWIIDHATGALLYRWGNPSAWGAEGAQELYRQHNVHWIPDGLDGAGDLLIFDNGDPILRPWSRVVQIAPPLEADGSYRIDEPPQITWEYVADEPTSLFATHISGAQRQPEGTTLICDGPQGRFFGVDTHGTQVWSHSYGGSLFRAERYPPDHPALAGRDLSGLGEYPADENDAPDGP